MSYNGVDKNGKHLWDKIESIDFMKFEFSGDIRVKVTHWNMCTQRWLRRYIYERIYTEQELRTNKFKASIAQLITFLLSAVMHGFYPGYYLFFM